MKPKSFVIGNGVECDLDRLMNTRLLVQANSGAGKSWALRRLLEQTHGQIQQLVIDPEGEFASLREKFDYVLAARSGGDTSADPRTAKLLAERLLELGVSAILDIYELKPHERVKFVKLFLDALVDAPKTLWHPVLVLLDEAHMYAPEQGDAESADAVKSLATRGRKRGFCLVAATQRLSKLHKDVAAECNNKLIGRSSLDVDMKRASDELGFSTKEERLSLRDLDDGQFYAFGPALSKIVTKVKVGAVQTTHPKAGSHLAAVVPPPTDKVRALLPKLSDLPAEAEAREKSVADLKRDLANTRRELTEAKKAQPVAKTERIEVPVIAEKHLRQLEQIAHRLNGSADKIFDRAHALLQPVVAAVSDLRGAVNEIVSIAKPVQARAVKPAALVRPTIQKPTTPKQAIADDGEGLTGPEQRILDAIMWLESIGVTEPEQPAVAFLAGYTYGGGAFNNPRGRLNQRGLVEYRGDQIRLTDAGRELANAPDVVLTNNELHDRILSRLPGPEQRVLKPLIAAYPNELDDQALADAANYAAGAGAFNNPKGRLRSLGLIEYPRPKTARARDILFPEGV